MLSPHWSIFRIRVKASAFRGGSSQKHNLLSIKPDIWLWPSAQKLFLKRCNGCCQTTNWSELSPKVTVHDFMCSFLHKHSDADETNIKGSNDCFRSLKSVSLKSAPQESGEKQKRITTTKWSFIKTPVWLSTCTNLIWTADKSSDFTAVQGNTKIPVQ